MKTGLQGNIMKILINSALERRIKLVSKLSMGVLLAYLIKYAMDNFDFATLFK